MKKFSSGFIKNNSVRRLIVLLFTVEIVFFALLTGYLSYTSGLHTITENANQTSATVNDEITKMLLNYLEEPYKLEQIHKNMILNQQIDFSDPEQRDKHFVEMLKIFPRVTNSYVGLVNGAEYGARREDDGNFTVWNTTVDKQTLDYYRYDNELGRQGYLTSLSSYDIRQRPSYLKGVESKNPGWTDVYSSATGRGLVITAVYPVYGQHNELIGILGSSLLLDWIDEFLQSLTVTKHSSIFIIDKNEKLIATTDDALRRTRQGATNALISACDSKNPLLTQGVEVLKAKVQSVDAIKEDVNLRFDCNGEKFLLHAHPIYGRNNLEWISMILIPEKDLAYSMHDLINQLLFITILACILGLITGVFSASYIINPIIKVNRMAKKIAEGDFSAKIDIDRQDEVGRLVHTVNEMSTKLEESFKKLRQDRLRIKLLTAGLETSSNLVIILDENQLIWWINASFEALSGFTLKEVVGRNVKMLLSKQNHPQVLLQVNNYLLQQREWRGEIIVNGKDGQNYVDEVSVTPILDDVGKTLYFLVVGQDITEKVKAREAMLAAQEARIKAEKIFSIGTMAAGVSHEINQPLNSIKVISGGIVYLLNQGEKLEAEEFAESIKEISSQADRITKIIKHLRSFIRRDKNQLMPCNLNTSVEMALEVVGKQLADHTVTVQRNLQENLPPVLALSTGLEEIIINLLVNAMQALDTTDKKNKEIIIRTYFSEKVILEVSDNGPGVDPTLEKTIFESFTSTKLHGENLGLGLAIVNTIVASYSGTIKVASSAMSGTTFTVALPPVQNNHKENINEDITCR